MKIMRRRADAMAQSSSVMKFLKEKMKKKEEANKKICFKKSVHKKSPLWYQTRMFWYFVIPFPPQSFVVLCAQHYHAHISLSLYYNIMCIILFLSFILLWCDLCAPSQNFFLCDPTILLYTTYSCLFWDDNVFFYIR